MKYKGGVQERDLIFHTIPTGNQPLNYRPNSHNRVTFLRNMYLPFFYFLYWVNDRSYEKNILGPMTIHLCGSLGLAAIPSVIPRGGMEVKRKRCGEGIVQQKWKRLSVDAPSRDVPSLSVFLPKSRQKDVKTSCRDVMTSYHDVTWRHDVMPWRHMTSGVMTNWLCVIHPSETSEITFFNLATLTFDLWPWPLNLAEIISRSFPLPNLVTLGQTVQPWERWLTDTQTHRQTDGTDFIPSTADAGGKYSIKDLKGRG